MMMIIIMIKTIIKIIMIIKTKVGREKISTLKMVRI